MRSPPPLKSLSSLLWTGRRAPCIITGGQCWQVGDNPLQTALSSKKRGLDFFFTNHQDCGWCSDNVCSSAYAVNVLLSLRRVLSHLHWRQQVSAPSVLLLLLLLRFSIWMYHLNSRWVDITKFLTGASVVGSIAIPTILKHADVIGWGALAMELSSFFVFGLAIVLYMQMSSHDDYAAF